jgi:hypothetical protein
VSAFYGQDYEEFGRPAGAAVLDETYRILTTYVLFPWPEAGIATTPQALWSEARPPSRPGVTRIPASPRWTDENGGIHYAARGPEPIPFERRRVIHAGLVDIVIYADGGEE